EHSWLGLAFAASASIAGLVGMTQDAFGPTVLLVALPVIAMFLSTLHLFFRQAEAEDRVQGEKVAAAEREVAESARHMSELQASEERFHSAFTHAAVGMLLVSRDCRILQTNEALCEQLGRKESEVSGQDLMQIIHPDDIGMLNAEIGGLLSANASTFSTELRCVHGNGSVVWVASNGALFSAEGSGEHCLIMQMQDVTARKRAETKLHHIAYHDGLTNLPNRSYFFGELGRAVATAKRDPKHTFAVLFLDFDRFKTINDSMGHGAGDELLKNATSRLQGCLLPADFIARMGGDEFAILIEAFRTEGEVIELAERIQGVLREPMLLDGVLVSTSASIGITTSAFHYTAPENVMRDADIALYRAKAQGKARHAMFDSALHVEVLAQLRMEGELRRAIEENRLSVAFQPIFDLRTKRLYGFEALARWKHDERGFIAPTDFIPLAEETGLIVPLGNRILEIACRQLAAWRDAVPAGRNLNVHVNVSSVQLAQRDYAARTLEIIGNAGVPCDRITLEVTESVLIDRLKCALPNLRQLREHGLRISIDDFGKGYSSLSTLEELPIGELKIDRSFVQRLTKGEGEAVVNAILALGRSMGKSVIVEGIETASQLEHLLRLGCERGQGFLLGMPLSAAAAENLVRDSAPIARVAWSRKTAVA
ncbi:MAG: EAL domain-containing protein, partial [Betaproteobacteria bacterium]